MLTRKIEAIVPVPEPYFAAAMARWNRIAKPLGSLGLLEPAIARLAAVQETEMPTLSRRGVAVFCADHGVVAQGVTQCDSSVTTAVVQKMAEGKGCISHLARCADAEVQVIDMGMQTPVVHPRVRSHRLGAGTADSTQEPAMTREQCEDAILFGMEVAAEYQAAGFSIVVAGEMGIGNTTAASAVASVLLELPPAQLTGKGAGLSAAGVAHKIEVIEQAIRQNHPNPKDPLDVLAKLGGFELAAMTGLFLGGAHCHLPIIVDGFLSSVSALCALRFSPLVRGILFGSHCSAEPAGQTLCDALGIAPPLYAELRLGEGSGGVMLLPLLDMALEIYRSMEEFSEFSIPAYDPAGEPVC